VKDENLFIHSAIFRPGAKPSDAVLGEPVDPNAVATNPTPPVRRAEPVRTKKFYTVRPGDTLSEIATRNNTTVSKICSLNGLRVTSVIQPGQSLRVK
jgi:LysM repeat protein